MIASNMGNVSLVQHLVESGANTSLVDSISKNALQIVLTQSYYDGKYAQTKLAQLYRLLVTSSISIKVEDRLIKIDNHLMEFFLFNLMMSISHNKLAGKYRHHGFGFCTEDFMKPLENFPESVLLGRRKKRNYISSILSKNEMDRNDRYNRMLFLRTGHGRYILNPRLEIKIDDEWCKLYSLMAIDYLDVYPGKLHNEAL